MNEKIKKTIIILVVILIFGAISVGVYLGMGKAKNVTVPGQSSSGGGVSSFPVSSGSGAQSSSGMTNVGSQQNQLNTANPPVGDQAYQAQKSRLFQLATHQTIGFWVASSTTSSPSGILRALVYYINPNGDVVLIQDVGREQTIAASSFGTPLHVWQSPNGLMAVVSFDSGTYALFDVKTKAWKVLPDGVKSVAFAPSGRSLAMLKESGGQTAISIMNLSLASKAISPLVSFAAVDLTLLWPSPNNLLLLSRPSSVVDGQAWLIDVSTKTFLNIAHGNGLQIVTSQKNPYHLVAYTATNGGPVQIKILSISGDVAATIPFETVADKCVFGTKDSELVCAVPYQNDSGSSIDILSSYLERGVYFHDVVYRIWGDKFSTISPLLTAPDISIDVVYPRVIGSQLFFLNRLDGTVYLYNLSS